MFPSLIWLGIFLGVFFGRVQGAPRGPVEINAYMPCAIACRYVLLNHPPALNIHRQRSCPPPPFHRNSFNPLNKKSSKCNIPNKPCFKTVTQVLLKKNNQPFQLPKRQGEQLYYSARLRNAEDTPKKVIEHLRLQICWDHWGVSKK